uniref:Uncharacterized protein n=1 Tax=Haptolina ericina TaxID=156174 RepID=A0A7S3AI50_9EUKA
MKEALDSAEPKQASVPVAAAFMLEVTLAPCMDRARFFSGGYWRQVLLLKKTSRVQLMFALMSLTVVILLIEMLGRLIQVATDLLVGDGRTEVHDLASLVLYTVLTSVVLLPLPVVVAAMDPKVRATCGGKLLLSTEYLPSILYFSYAALCIFGMRSAYISVGREIDYGASYLAVLPTALGALTALPSAFFALYAGIYATKYVARGLYEDPLFDPYD